MSIYEVFDRFFAWINRILGEPVEETIPIVQDLPKSKTGIGSVLGSLIPEVSGSVVGSSGIIGSGAGVGSALASTLVPAFVGAWAIGFGSEAYRFFSGLGQKSRSEFYNPITSEIISKDPLKVSMLKSPG